MAMAMQSESERSWPCDSSSARRCRLLPPRLLGDFWFISKRIICTHCSIACADKHGSWRYISSADIPIPARREQGMLWNALSMRVYANSKAPCSKPLPSPQCFFFQGFFSSKLFLSKLFVRSVFFKEYWRILKEVVIKLRAAKRWRDGTCPQQNPQHTYILCFPKFWGRRFGAKRF